MKKIVAILFFAFFQLQAFASSLKDDMLPNGNTWGIWSEGTWALTEVLIYAKDFLFSILAIVSIAVFVFYGFKLVVARWSEEEFKKALTGFLYVVIGLAIIPLAWWAVKIISTLKF